MTQLYITSAAAVGPLGTTLEEIWQKLLQGQVAYSKAEINEKFYFVAETMAGSASKIHEYAPLFSQFIKKLISSLNITETIDVIFLLPLLEILLKLKATFIKISL
ncbi:hypothetical protein [Bartonella pachyuromydis]|uniref:Beta-ketoacyl-[acyl-carrier-protein] synthase II n=1 Tax=Bartonella pachyuromydis TaxID=931097 RepID=A0ABP8VNQ5_9HYPH